MAKDTVLGITLPGWLRYGLDADGVKPSLKKVKSQNIQPMSAENKILAEQLSEEIWRQRIAKEQAREKYTLRLNEEAAEGVEKILWALAKEDYDFANVRVAQLIRGLLADAPHWKDGFDTED